jgi:hypothetical protein
MGAGGIDIAKTLDRGQLELRPWTETHLVGGRFEQDETLARFQGIVQDAKRKAYPLIRFVTDMEWALECGLSPDDLLEYEAKANAIWIGQSGPVNPVVCSYDLTKFGGALVVDILRTHPLTIIGGVLEENPFFVPPEQFIRERRDGGRAHDH